MESGHEAKAVETSSAGWIKPERPQRTHAVSIDRHLCCYFSTTLLHNILLLCPYIPEQGRTCMCASCAPEQVTLSHLDIKEDQRDLVESPMQPLVLNFDINSFKLSVLSVAVRPTQVGIPCPLCPRDSMQATAVYRHAANHEAIE